MAASRRVRYSLFCNVKLIREAITMQLGLLDITLTYCAT